MTLPSPSSTTTTEENEEKEEVKIEALKWRKGRTPFEKQRILPIENLLIILKDQSLFNTSAKPTVPLHSRCRRLLTLYGRLRSATTGDAISCSVIKMSFSRLSNRTHLLPLLQHSRCIADALRSNYKYTGGSTRNNDMWGLMPKCGFSSCFIKKSYQSQSFGSNGLWRPSSLASFSRSYASQASMQQKSQKMLWYLTALVFAMVGCTYAAVPLYRRFCQATGYGGTVQRRETVEEKIARHSKDGTVASREIVVQFNADVADGMPWKFVPTQREVRVKPGESALAFYTAENRSQTPITGVSTYNVTPMKAALYFNKIQCFCFEEQRLLPGEQIDMPVFFYIDPEFETDPRMDGINNLILSYTFFKVSDE
ncbi:hypothetical protein ACOSQ4_026659 [Xanthoceras sorbifolium]